MSSFVNRLTHFLAKNGQPAELGALTPDASTREYYRVKWKDAAAIACVYPEDVLGSEQFKACLDVTGLFLAAGLPVAEVFAHDDENLIIIHEDFGDVILREVLASVSSEDRERYLDDSIRLIARIQAATALAFERHSVASQLRFDSEKLIWELDFFKTHYFKTLRGRPLSEEDSDALSAEFATLAGELESHARVLTHRDFHAANIMLTPAGLRIIDHQDARIGSASYDLVSLLLDRVTTLPSPEWLAEKRSLLLASRVALGLDSISEAEFADEFRLQTIQRCLKAIGTFSFQAANRGKTHFTEYIDPMFGIVARAAGNLDRYPVLGRLIDRELSNS